MIGSEVEHLAIVLRAGDHGMIDRVPISSSLTPCLRADR
jgi:hypothetical protein